MNYSNLLNQISLGKYRAFLNSNLSELWFHVTDNALGFFISVIATRSEKSVFVLTPYPEQSLYLNQQLTRWLSDSINVLRFPEINIAPFETSRADISNSSARAGILADIKQKNNKLLILSSVLASSEITMNLDNSRDRDHINIEKGQSIVLSDLNKRLIGLGYSMEPYVLEQGSMSIRGSIIDVFPSNLKNPIRIEFFDDEIESIRNFDVNSQKSTDILIEVFIFSRFEVSQGLIDKTSLGQKFSKCDFSKCDTNIIENYQKDFEKIISGELPQEKYLKYCGFINDKSIFDYITSDFLVILIRPPEIENSSHQLFRRYQEIKFLKEKRGEMPFNLPDTRLSWSHINDKLNFLGQRIVISPRYPKSNPNRIIEKIQSKVISINRNINLNDPLKSVREKILYEMDLNVTMVIITLNYDRVLEVFKEQEIQYEVFEEKLMLKGFPKFNPGTITLNEGYLREGFEVIISTGKQLKILTDNELFGVKRRTEIIDEKIKTKNKLDFNLLHPGSFVVHQNHGIGKFLRTTTLKNQGSKEFLEIEYAALDKLFLPVDQIYQIELYRGPSHPEPKLTRLGGNHWKKAKSLAMHSTEELASELLALQSSRMNVKGLKCENDTLWQNALESSFPFVETEDQKNALEEIKMDLEKTIPMDRVLCGDVGFGKTEIAVRASFKVIERGSNSCSHYCVS